MNLHRLAVVIPAYNEATRIEETLHQCIEYLQGSCYEWSIWVVDDGSKDGTAKKVHYFRKKYVDVHLIQMSENKGKGFAVRMGMLSAEADWILFSDADLATPIEELDKLAVFLHQGYDIAFGSRPLKESQLLIHQPFYREVLGRVFNKLVQLLTLPGVQDTQCGFKLFKGSVAKHVFSQSSVNGFIFDVEVLYLAKSLGYSYKEVPVRWSHQEGSKVDVWKHGIEALFELIRLKIRFMKLASKKLIRSLYFNGPL